MPRIPVSLWCSLLSGAVSAAAGCGSSPAPPSPPTATVTTLATQTTTFLRQPLAIAISPKDGHLYVADGSGAAPCSGSCIWTVDASTGALGAAPVVVGAGLIEGIAFDTTGDNLYYTERLSQVRRLTWDGSTYAAPSACVDPVAQSPLEPYRLVVDPGLGLLVADGNPAGVSRIATCSATASGVALGTGSAFASPRGIALGPAGEIYVSDNSRDEVFVVDRTTGAAAPFQVSGLSAPVGIQWLAGSSVHAHSLLVASQGNHAVVSVTAGGSTALATLASAPVDLAISGSNVYVAAAPSGMEPGRIYKIVLP